MPTSSALLGGFAIKERKGKERKGKGEYLRSAFFHQGTHKALRHGSHSLTCR